MNMNNLNKKGQSLIELIVAMAIGVILLVGGVSAIVPILKISSNVARIQAASALGKELLDNARVLADSNWHAFGGLSMGAANGYYIVASTSPFTIATGTESVAVATTTYTRHFYLEDVYRNPTFILSAGDVGPSDQYDPSTKKITVVYSWPPNASGTIVSYLVRTGDDVVSISDWTSGPFQDGPISATRANGGFASSSNIDYSGTPGSIVVTGF
jgi:prepilin-type N-terminal cleavage/methylation domain-containing protein